MTTLNEVKLAGMSAALGDSSGSMDEVEHKWLTFKGVAVSGSLSERRQALFGTSEHDWLTSQGVEESGSLNERWMKYWTGVAPVPGEVTHLGVTVTHLGTPVTHSVTTTPTPPPLPPPDPTTDITGGLAIAAAWDTFYANVLADEGDFTSITFAGSTQSVEGAFLRLSTVNGMVTEPLVDGTTYRLTFTAETEGLCYIGLSDKAGQFPFVAGENVVDFIPSGSTDANAAFLNIYLIDGPGQVERIHHTITIEKLP